MPLLSHYTSKTGLEGIAKSKTLHATSFLQLNDKSEYVYAWEILQRFALEIAIQKLPPDAIKVPVDINDRARKSTEQFKALFSGDIGLMYVVSFAMSSSSDHERRGILTLWEKYTKHEGYCLQFDQRDIERLVEFELMKGSYAALSLSPVIYGVDTESREFRVLCYQLAQQFLLQVMRAKPGLRVQPDFQDIWADSYLHRKLMEFCGLHKDPCFEDEREVRIVGFPADQAAYRPFTGVATIKKRRTAPSGKGYIDIGEYWTPTLTPRRMIMGTKADPDISAALAYYNPKPEIAHANLPVA